MFEVLYNIERSTRKGAGVVKTVYAVDRATASFLVTDWWDNFEWVPMSECTLYIPEDEEEK